MIPSLKYNKPVEVTPAMISDLVLAQKTFVRFQTESNLHILSVTNQGVHVSAEFFRQLIDIHPTFVLGEKFMGTHPDMPVQFECYINGCKFFCIANWHEVSALSLDSFLNDSAKQEYESWKLLEE